MLANESENSSSTSLDKRINYEQRKRKLAKDENLKKLQEAQVEQDESIEIWKK